MCVLVAAEPLDTEFETRFVLFRDTLDELSGAYIHFFALTDLNGRFSVAGKQALVDALQGRNIDVRYDEALLVFIRLLAPKGSEYYVADVMGVLPIRGQLRPEHVEPILIKITKMARDAKMGGVSFEEFVEKVEDAVGWLRIRQELSLAVPLLRLLAKAINFVRA